MEHLKTGLLKLPMPSTIPTTELVPQEWRDTLEEKLFAARVWMRERGMDDAVMEQPGQVLQELSEPTEISVRRVA